MVKCSSAYGRDVLSAGNYGFSGMQEFSIMAKEAGICEATAEKISNNADNEAFDKVLYSVSAKTKPITLA